MKVLCDREKLREALSVVTGVIPLKSTRPAIENVCLVATDEALELVGTDLEVAVRYRIDDVKVEEAGTTLVPARISSDFVRDLAGETVTLETKGDKFLIKTGTDRCELTTLDPDEFPVVARFEADDSLAVQAGTFTKLVNRTAFAAAREPGRYAMHGLMMQVEEGVLRMVATDGRRLAVATWPIESNGAEKQAIVPTKGMQLFSKVISDPLEEVKIHFGEGQIGLKTKDAEVFARLIDGEYPRYSAVIPATVENFVEADATMLNQKLRLVSAVTTADTRAVRLSFSKGKMKVFGRSSGFGEATAQMEVEFKGTATEIAFNPDYLMDGLKNCESDTVRLEFNDKTSPGKFTLGEEYMYIVMPITVDT